MSYEDKNRLVFANAKNGKVEAGARVAGDKTDEAQYSVLEADAHAGYNYSIYGAGAGVGAEAQVFNFKDDKSKTSFRAFGVDIKGSAGFDTEAFVKKGHYFGAEAKVRATLSEAKAGPIGLHLGAGISTGAKVEDGTFDAKLAGCGLKVGKRIGVAVFDNEFSFETLSLFGKGWLWGDFD